MSNCLPALEVCELGPGEEPRWNAFVARHPESNLYHTTDWRDVLQEAFGHVPHYLICENAGETRGVLALFFVRLPVLGAKLISVPYDIGSGGALAVDPLAERRLIEVAMEVAAERGVQYLELRCGSARPAIEGLGLNRCEPVIISDVELDERESVWSRVARGERKAVRQARNRGVEVSEARSLADYREFFNMYARVFRSFGTPPYGMHYFSTLWHRLHAEGYARILVARAGARYLGGMLLFTYGREVVAKVAACDPDAASLRVYPALYWHAMELGLELGCSRLSLGTSSREQTGLLEFKGRWGARHRPTVSYSLPVRGRVPSVERYYESDGLARAVWRRLPLAATTFLGPYVNRWFC